MLFIVIFIKKVVKLVGVLFVFVIIFVVVVFFMFLLFRGFKIIMFMVSYIILGEYF